jgi:RNA polymerase sigma factor (sigma-70 family)
VQQLRRGEPEAVDIVRRRVRRTLSYRGFGMGPQDREDLEQEVMTQVWQGVNRREFDVDRGFWGFVDVVVGRRSIDWLRVHKPTVALTEVTGEPLRSPRRGPLQEALSSEQIRLAFAAVKGLGHGCRELVLLRVGLGKSYREIAELTGRTEGALRTQFCRCIEKARREIEANREGSAQERKDVKNDGRT